MIDGTFDKLTITTPDGRHIMTLEREHQPRYCLGCGERQQASVEVHAAQCELPDRRLGWTTDSLAAERIAQLTRDWPAAQGRLADLHAELREARNAADWAEHMQAAAENERDADQQRRRDLEDELAKARERIAQLEHQAEQEDAGR